MLCPHCQQELTSTTIQLEDKREALINECFNCGGHFFSPLLANFTPIEIAKNVDSITPKNLFPKNQSVLCPTCKRTMVGIRDDVIPKGVEIFTCPDNHGVFFPKGMLFAFKKAQKAKLEYHQIWGIPLKSAFAILLPVAILFTGISVLPMTIDQFKQNQENRTKANDFITRPLISPISPNQVIVSFTSVNEGLATITLNTPTGPRAYSDTNIPQITHVITLTDLQPGSSYTYTITIDKNTSTLYSFTTLSY